MVQSTAESDVKTKPVAAAEPVATPEGSSLASSAWIDVGLALLAVALAAWAWVSAVPPGVVRGPLIVMNSPASGSADAIVVLGSDGFLTEGGTKVDGVGLLLSAWQRSGKSPTTVELQVDHDAVSGLAIVTAQRLGEAGVREVRIVPAKK